ncbi:DUF1361 domain-containing protein [Amycolatopsis anabasis]|uniref:DUF1361 domain-containing protein n=1 Tax=Amycolatopsis anabasis TaxID=1840409 RepID=UPI00131D3986|nr:DUF1361 domain-containing protein [Amycolatopsis anabasis]
MDLLLGNVPWMAWNLVLALVPAALSVPLFVLGRRPTPFWWLGLVTFVAFLPNAPYVLSDVIHFIDQVRRTHDNLLVAFGLIPQYLLFFLTGFGCYALSIIRLQRWLRARGWSWTRLLAVEVVLHALCAVGIFLGRVFRFNSWDLITTPGAIADVVRIPQPTSVLLLVLTFLVLAGGTGVLHLVTRSPLGRAVQRSMFG